MIPRVYGAIHAVAVALSKDGIAKERLNARDDYLYRGIDDVLKRLSPLLAEHRLCILPRVLERSSTDRIGEDGKLLMSVAVKAAFDVVSVEDGSIHIIESFGEALDGGDKGTAKAMQSAYKYAVLQAFCVPVEQTEDADRQSHRIVVPRPQPAPANGWQQWADQYLNESAKCQSAEEISRVQEASRPMLASLSREQPALYRTVGEAVAKLRENIASSPSAKKPARPVDARGREGGPGPPPPSRTERAFVPSIRLPERIRREGRVADARSCPAHRAWIRRHRCSVPDCAALPIECAHVRTGTDGGQGLKPSDNWTVSLCRQHHAEQHRIGERAFEKLHDLDLYELAIEFARRSPHWRTFK